MNIPVIDTHQHLIYPGRYPYSWTEGSPQLDGQAFHLPDYLDAVAGAGIGGTIFMEAAVDDPHWPSEAEFVCGLTEQKNSIVQGVIAGCRPESQDDFEAYIKEIRHPRLVGFRRILHLVPDELSQQPKFSQNVRLLEKYDLTFDLCVLARQLPLGLDLARQCPNVRFILDHCGVPDIAGQALDPWRTHIRAMAEMPNVSCKISGVLAYCSPENATIEAVRPYVEHCLECFGWERVVWGGDWPVCLTATDLKNWLAVTRELVATADPKDQQKLFSQNAERIYGLPASPRQRSEGIEPVNDAVPESDSGEPPFQS